MKNFMVVVFILVSFLVVSCGGGSGDDNTDNDTSCVWLLASEYGADQIMIFGSGTEDVLHTQATNGYYFDIFVDGLIADPDGWKTHPSCEGNPNSWGFRFHVYKVDSSGSKYYEVSYFPSVQVQIGGQIYDCKIIDDIYEISYFSGVFLIPIEYNGILSVEDPFEQLFSQVEKIFVDGTEVNMASRNY